MKSKAELEERKGYLLRILFYESLPASMTNVIRKELEEINSLLVGGAR